MKIKPLQHENQLIPYEIRHQPNITRRIHLRTAPDGSLMVIAPRRMSKRSVHQTLQEQVQMVVRFLADAQDRQQEIPPCDYINGEQHLYLGRLYPLDFVPAGPRQGSVSFTGESIRINSADHAPDQVKRQLEAWYRVRAAERFEERIRSIAGNAAWVKGKTPPIRLRKMKRTWGSCSASGKITLNPRLMKTPEDCIDYVIAHELCHLREMNHGKAFYSLLQGLYPAWLPARTHLRDHAHIYLHE